MDLFVTPPIVNDGNVSEVLSLAQRLGFCTRLLAKVQWLHHILLLRYKMFYVHRRVGLSLSSFLFLEV